MGQLVVKFKKIIIYPLVMTVFFAVTGQYSQAAWPTENILGMDLGSVLNLVEQKTQSIILSRMQQEAIKQIQTTMGDLVMGGTGKGSYVITNYYDFIYGTSKREGEAYLERFFQTLREGADRGMVEMFNDVESQLKKDLFGGMPKSTLGDYVENETGERSIYPIENVFAGKTMDAYREWKMGDYNDPRAVYNQALAGVRNYMETVRDVQRTKAIANQGFDPQNGIPGSVMAQLVAEAQSAPIEMISNATSVEQVVTSLATSTLVSFMKTGYKNSSAPSLNQIQKINQKYEGGVDYIQSMIYAGQN